MIDHWVGYRCPSCRQPLLGADNALVCEHGHRFDRNKKGFVHLLLSHQMGSRHPGDSKMMVQARRNFLDLGHYRPLAQSLAQVCRDLGARQVLDAGCGEGYYACELNGAGLQVAGMDISKEAILGACRRDKRLPWCVASVAELPYLDAGFDAVLSVFSRINEGEFARVLRPGGAVIYVGPGEDHLPALRAGLYREVRPYQADKPPRYFPHMKEVASHRVQFEFSLDGAEEVDNLLKMTPHYWNSNPDQHQRLLAGQGLTDRADIQICVFRHNELAPTPPRSDTWQVT